MFLRRIGWSRLSAALLAVLLVLALGVWIGQHPSWVPSVLRVGDRNGRLVDEVLSLIAHDYYRPVNTSSLLNTGLAQAVASLNDPYSHYLDPSDYNHFENESNPHESGVGVDVSTVSRGLKVVDVFPGTPAARAGLTAGDVITAVGRHSLAGTSAAEATGLITGQAGTRVTLTVLMNGRRRVISLRRADVLVSSGGIVVEHGVKIGDVRLTSFTQGAGTAVRSEVQKVLHQGARGLILDLRDNGGGLLDEAINVASVFIPDGTIVSTRGRSQPEQVYAAKGGAIPTGIPMVVLVDRGTASAAEIVTGALKDRGRAKVVGTHTYGKGVFQEVQPLSNGGALDLTVGEYFTPNGHNLGGGGVREGAGIAPDINALDNPHTTSDEALIKAEQTVVGELRRS